MKLIISKIIKSDPCTRKNYMYHYLCCISEASNATLIIFVVNKVNSTRFQCNRGETEY